MKTLIALPVIFLILVAAVFPQEEIDREIDGFKGLVKRVEVYEINFWESESERIKGKRNLSGVTLYDRTGNALESVSFTNDGNGAYYDKYVYNYSSKGKKISTDHYVSAKGKPNRLFTVDTRGNQAESLIQKLGETLFTRTVHRYDEKGRQVEELTFDANGNTTERKVFSYNEDGKQSKFSILKLDGTPTLEIISDYKNQGRTVEDTRIENGIEVFKIIYYYDGKGRITQEEQFNLKPKANAINEKEVVLDNKSINTYAGEKREMEWLLFDSNGAPREKLLILDKNDEEVSRERYAYWIPPSENTNPEIKPEWRLQDREIREYEYDKQGNWVKCIWSKQEKPDKPLLIDLIIEQVITYY